MLVRGADFVITLPLKKKNTCHCKKYTFYVIYFFFSVLMFNLLFILFYCEVSLLAQKPGPKMKILSLSLYYLHWAQMRYPPAQNHEGGMMITKSHWVAVYIAYKLGQKKLKQITTCIGKI